MTHAFADQRFERDPEGTTLITFMCTCGAVIGPLSADPIAAAWIDHARTEALEA